jgi:hypothetical protein
VIPPLGGAEIAATGGAEIAAVGAETSLLGGIEALLGGVDVSVLGATDSGAALAVRFFLGCFFGVDLPVSVLAVAVSAVVTAPSPSANTAELVSSTIKARLVAMLFFM